MDVSGVSGHACGRGDGDPFRSLLVPVVIMCAQPLAVIAAGIWFAYYVGGGLYGVALAAVAILSMGGGAQIGYRCAGRRSATGTCRS
jgi:Na+/H+-translocating membrane pyrophosphatase